MLSARHPSLLQPAFAQTAPSASIAFCPSLPVQIQHGADVSSMAPSSQGHVPLPHPACPHTQELLSPLPATPSLPLMCISRCGSGCFSELSCVSLSSISWFTVCSAGHPSTPTGPLCACWSGLLAVTCGWNYEDPTAQQPSRGQVLRKPSFPPLLSMTSLSCVSVLFVWASDLKTGLCVENTREMLEGSGHVTHTCCDFLGVGDQAACGVWEKNSVSRQSPAHGVWTARQHTRLAQ